MLFKKLQLVFILGIFGFGMAACGDDGDMGSDSASSDTPMAEAADGTLAEAADGTLADYDPDVPSMVVEDNGVVSW